MRRILFITAAILVFLISGCKTPEASFIFSPDSVAVGDTVYFQSTSQNAVSFKWDLGDGTTTTAEHPIHIYETAGEFSVVLVIYNHRGSDKTRDDIIVSQSSR